jgi:hypothetical protein
LILSASITLTLAFGMPQGDAGPLNADNMPNRTSLSAYALPFPARLNAQTKKTINKTADNFFIPVSPFFLHHYTLLMTHLKDQVKGTKRDFRISFPQPRGLESSLLNVSRPLHSHIIHLILRSAPSIPSAA